MLTTVVRIVVDPADDRLEHDLFVLDIEVVTADDLNHRLVGQHQQLVALGRDVREMLHNKPVLATHAHTYLPSLYPCLLGLLLVRLQSTGLSNRYVAASTGISVDAAGIQKVSRGQNNA